MAFGRTHIPIQEGWKQVDPVSCTSLVQLRNKEKKKKKLGFASLKLGNQDD